MINVAITNQLIDLIEVVTESFHVKSSVILENFNPTSQNSLKFGILVEIYKLENSTKNFEKFHLVWVLWPLQFFENAPSKIGICEAIFGA